MLAIGRHVSRKINQTTVASCRTGKNHVLRCYSTRAPFAFAFDIDGVLLKSSKPIPGASESLALLKRHDIPFILLTNGGGLPEATRVANLSHHLGIDIQQSQFIQSHTPFVSHSTTHGYKNVLVCGGILDACRTVAKNYGFKHVTIPLDCLARDASMWPYHTLTKEEKDCTIPLSKDPIDAIYVFHDPRDWGLDSQIIMDVLLSESGQIGTRTKDLHKHQQSIPLFFSNPDLVWANAYPHTRFGQGAFQILMEGLYRAMTGQALQSRTIGKPSSTTYEFASKVLGLSGPVYMVGDNKASDIEGANDFGWESILVRTGVFDGTKEEGTSGNVPAKYCVEDVREAVSLVLRKHGIDQ